MYELVKKKPTGMKVLLGAVVVIVLISMLKILFLGPKRSLSDDLVKIANAFNQHMPMTIDSVTRLDNVTAQGSNILQYNYTLLKNEISDVDTTYLIQSNKPIMLNKLKTNPKILFFKENNIDIWEAFSDKNGVYICTIRLSHNDFK